MKQEFGIEKIMVRTLRCINKLIEIAVFTYTFTFKILTIGGHLVTLIIKAGVKLGIKNKNEDTLERNLKGSANILIKKIWFIISGKEFKVDKEKN